MRLWNRDLQRALLLLGGLCACGSDENSDKDKTDSAVVTDDDAGTESDAGSDACEKDDDVGAVEASTAPHPDDSNKANLPVVFVHGFVGSASQFDSQAQRLVANGYSPNKLFAYEHDGLVLPADVNQQLDKIIEGARTKFGTSQVFLLGHSRGTSVSNGYLTNPEYAKKVAKVVLLDGRPCETVTNGVPCDAPNQLNLPGHKHVEVSTSGESFKRWYKFLFDKEPSVVDITKEAARVDISGRAVNFPANTGRDGAVLKVYEVDADTGRRRCETEIASFELDASGDWGPLRVNPDRHYELTLSGAGSDAIQHFYSQPFLRGTKFVRLLSGPPDSASRTNSNLGPEHAGLTIIRMREWTEEDVLKISETSDSGDANIDDVLTPEVANPRGAGGPVSGAIALYVQDDKATPKQTTNALLPYFSEQPFQTGADVYLPAADPTNGVITVTNLPRGDAAKPQTLAFPNWPIDKHTIMVYFSDFPQ